MVALQHEPQDHAFRILLVDDNPEDMALYHRLLKKSNLDFELYEAGSAREGLRLSREKKPDCIVLDYRLPDSDGIGFIDSYQEESADCPAAIVMVTGCGSEQIAVEAMKRGALDYLSKASISEGFFVRNILNAIERSHLKNQVREYQEELERSNRALSDFTYTVSHDLKAPLRRIVSFCDLLKEDVGDRLGSEATQYMDRLVVNASRLHKLVGDLLSYSQVMHSREERETVDLGGLIDGVREDLSVLIRENRAAITVGNMPFLSVYPMRMKQLFQNLLTNAIKYHGPETPVIAVQCKDQGTYCLFSVKDNGIGIPGEYHEKIFKDFERLHTQDQIEGSGLGLSICRKVAEMHDGRIWVESEPGKGSTFFCTIRKS